jgi:hypothetical protein
MKLTRFLFAVVMCFAGSVVMGSVYCEASAQGTKSGQSEGSLADGSAFTVELSSSLDSKKVKPGDTFTAKTTETLKSADDRIMLPKGAKVIGHVTQASARGKGAADSELGMAFDKVILKDGQEMPLKVTVQALAPPANTGSASAGGPDLDTMGNSSPGRPSAPTNNPSMSGSRGARPTPNYPTEGGAQSGAADAPGSMNTSGQLSPNSRGVYGMDGLRLAAAPNDAQATVITSNGKNVHLDSGTRLLLVSQAQRSGAPSGH